MNEAPDQIKRLALLGGIGAGLLGAGIALLFARWLQPFAIPGIVTGVAAHGWAMYAKGKLEHQSTIRRPKWSVAAEWLCGLMLAGLIVYVLVVSYSR